VEFPGEQENSSMDVSTRRGLDVEVEYVR